jgi:hypothetical protein
MQYTHVANDMKIYRKLAMHLAIHIIKRLRWPSMRYLDEFSN